MPTDNLGHIKHLVEQLEIHAKPVHATSANTNSVKRGFEQGGYIKHYEVSPHALHALTEHVLTTESNSGSNQRAQEKPCT